MSEANTPEISPKVRMVFFMIVSLWKAGVKIRMQTHHSASGGLPVVMLSDDFAG